jgi:DNA repair protein RadC
MNFNKITDNEFKLKEIKTVPYRKNMKVHKTNSSQEIYKYIKRLREIMQHEDYTENFYIFILSNHLNMIGWKRLSIGTTHSTTVDIKQIAKFAIELLGNNVVIAHNHPSGNCFPSEADIELTNKIKEALSLFNIKLVDHIIFTEEVPLIDDKQYYSFIDNDQL